jgi:hypothetical protein
MPTDPAPELTPAEQARQGETSGHMRRVLGISFAAAAVALAIILAVWVI